jgi:uncharacterized membrane protein YgcG
MKKLGRSLRKVPTIVLATLLYMTCLSPTVAFAAPDTHFSVGSTQGSPGEDVSVVVIITNNPGHTTGTFTINYDTDALVLKSITADTVLSGKLFTSDTSKSNRFAVLDIQATGITGDGEYVKLVFGIKTDASLGAKTVSMSVTDNSAMNFVFIDNTARTPIPVSFSAGSVNVVEPDVPGGGDNGGGDGPGGGGSNQGPGGGGGSQGTGGSSGSNPNNNSYTIGGDPIGGTSNPPDNTTTDKTPSDDATANRGGGTGITESQPPLTDNESSTKPPDLLWWLFALIAAAGLVFIIILAWQRRRKPADNQMPEQ